MKNLFSAKLSLVILLSVFSANIARAQTMVFNTDGLYNAEFFDNIYRGHFEDIEMRRDELDFVSIFNQYLRTFGRQCEEYLPADKVDIMNWECVKEQEWVTTNGYGMEISRTSNCIQWEQRESGFFASPDLYKAFNEVEKLHDANALREAMDLAIGPNALGNSVDQIHKTKALLFDMSRIFQINSCNSPAIKRFEENLKLFALNKPPIRMKGASKYTAMKKSGGPTGSQNWTKLIDDLVADQARTWAFNRYQQGSISGVTVLSKDNQGRPAIIKADYLYSGFGGNSKGWVKITFANGLPEGIYFFDFPNIRKTPSSSIVASYAQGKYGGE